MPRVLWCSDLHTGHGGDEWRGRVRTVASGNGLTATISTGDLTVARRLTADLEILATLAPAPLYFVLGNHDHYGASVASTRDRVIDLAARRPDIQWLPPRGVVPLGEDVVLLGVDGWADGRHGHPLDTPLRLNDDRFIEELANQPDRRTRLLVKQALADADANRVTTLLGRAAPLARRIVVATHIPPFVEVLPATGHLSGPDWPPLLICGATGTALRRFAEDHPGHQLLVLSGHTHVVNDVLILPNLRCRVGHGVKQLDLFAD